MSRQAGRTNHAELGRCLAVASRCRSLSNEVRPSVRNNIHSIVDGPFERLYVRRIYCLCRQFRQVPSWPPLEVVVQLLLNIDGVDR